jgi:hypothetical protein
MKQLAKKIKNMLGLIQYLLPKERYLALKKYFFSSFLKKIWKNYFSRKSKRTNISPTQYLNNDKSREKNSGNLYHHTISNSH